LRETLRGTFLQALPHYWSFERIAAINAAVRDEAPRAREVAAGNLTS